MLNGLHSTQARRTGSALVIDSFGSNAVAIGIYEILGFPTTGGMTFSVFRHGW